LRLRNGKRNIGKGIRTLTDGIYGRYTKIIRNSFLEMINNQGHLSHISNHCNTKRKRIDWIQTVKRWCNSSSLSGYNTSCDGSSEVKSIKNN